MNKASTFEVGDRVRAVVNGVTVRGRIVRIDTGKRTALLEMASGACQWVPITAIES